MTASMTELRRVNTIQQVACYLGCSEGTVRKLLREGRLKGTDFGTGQKRLWRITSEAVDTFLSGNGGRDKCQPTAPAPTASAYGGTQMAASTQDGQMDTAPDAVHSARRINSLLN
ncbi:MAG: hypothetical protein Alpg2KO_01320 [Alphaproteobacteria bacterium]